MGRYIEQTQARSELQQRIAADLRAKAAARAKDEGDPSTAYTAIDGVEDAEYMKGTKHTTSLAGVWATIFLAAVAVFIYFVVRVNS
ncbi:hypothetical protein L336_0113 [Candidatus Saccharimonas aalborgensis]|jgi:hypothetical protein|uniref:Uncharacterized protein n=1 Tax=Candidatus Saccharimonas aalborgensis TaxID=1332188 RepID=R4PLW1_9BACT|nr:hypothetical protein [Candidatus Saccharimonas aalborgensis]MBP7775109.1 hypothetical protein [Candidatus Saccharimonas sp.]QQR51620.1 MAG: hypothetical protein IPF89_02205 [Candidatus Saccharibacteria bacterium]AGL61824.1 hypothetical protein L336_0113 [Candidatus Saccharimonas aalborgensis]QQS68355.1 MAG: hypothetical protein IPP24_05100 [Candidatus Saccharibacteria bacterium]QQS70678.1 MAG: hypothetical protein IPP92_05100 [Candidatus Saccharibacteria bacterium]